MQITSDLEKGCSTLHSEMRKSAYLQVTRECNNKCIFCSNPQFEKDYSLEEAKEKVLEFRAERVTEIMLTGGEPTVYPFICEIIVFILGQGMTPRMITNGVRLDKDMARKLWEAGLRDINISIHTCRREIGDRLSGKKGHLELALAGLRNAIDAGFHTMVNSTINSLNVDHLHETAKYMIKHFPEAGHFVYNNLDPGVSDGNIQSRAGENPWIVAKLSDIELPLQKTLSLLKYHKKTFRVERVPLCYMRGFEKFSTETRKIVKDENYICSFIEEKGGSVTRKVKPAVMRTKVNACRSCSLDPVCAGIQKEYIDIYGTGEIYPVFCDAIEAFKIVPMKETKANYHDK